MSEPTGPLAGVTVLDLGQIYMAPYATLLLGLAGADVVKIEPRHGEHLRARGDTRGAGYPYLMLNSNKRGITLNLKHERGRELLLAMVERADVLVENFAPGVMDRLGVGAAVLMKLNPRLIYASGSGYGLSGPYRDYPAMDITVQAMAGIMATTGFPEGPPVKAGPAIADFMGGIHLYGGIVTALYEREKTGRGQLVEAAMFDSVFPSLASSLGLFFGSGGELAPRTGNRHSGLSEAPYNVYPTRDGHIALICVSNSHWQALLVAMGREDLAEEERFLTIARRAAHIDEVDALVSDWTSQFDTAPLWELLRERRVPAAPVRGLAHVVADRHLRERGMLQDIDYPDLGPVTVPHSPFRLSEHPVEAPRPAPQLGQHNEEVLCGWLGVSQEELARLREEAVI
jgi:crotonobetainyl-CoA:carnitine CoA-transferase CaiB-like acyl-CoA transferase